MKSAAGVGCVGSSRLAGSRAIGVASGLLALVVAWPVWGQPPEIANLSLRGCQIGATTQLVINGKHLGPDAKVLSPLLDEDCQLEFKANDEATRLECGFTVGTSVPPGVWPLRIANRDGISEPVLIATDRLGQMPMTDSIEALPVALSGFVSGASIARTQFTAQAGERIVLDAEARRLAARTNLLLRVRGPDGRQVAYNSGESTALGDPRIVLTIPEDGSYTVELHDAAFGGQAPNHFRLKIGDFHHADLPFPLVAAETSDLAEAVFLPLATDLPEEATLLLHAVPPPSRGALRTVVDPETLFSGPTPWVRRATARRPQVLSLDGRDEPQAVEAPVDIAGRLARPGTTNRYLVRLEGGRKWRFELLAQEAGSPLDGVISVRLPGGRGLGSNDDADNRLDPQLEVDVPGDAEAVVVEVRDLLDRGGPASVYHLSITPADEPRYALTVPQGIITVPRGGRTLVPITVQRHGPVGPLRIDPPDWLAELWPSEPVIIPPGRKLAFVSLRALAGQPLDSRVQEVLAQRENDPEALAMPITGPATAVTRADLQQASQLAFAVVPPAPIDVEWVGPTDFEWSADQTPEIPLAIRGPEGGKLRLRLVTTHEVPNKRINNLDLPDPDKALRLEPQLTEAATDAVETSLKLVIPPDFPTDTVHQMAVEAEWLGEKDQQILARATTSVATVRIRAKPADDKQE